MKRIFGGKFVAPFLAFVLPVAIFVIVLLIFALINGSATVIFTDAGAQYVDFLAFQKSLLAGEATPGFFLNGMLGSEGMPLLAYYLLSPFNLMIALFPIEALPYLFYFFVLVKIGLAGLFLYIFLNSYRDKEKQSVVNSRWMLLVFSTSYALCGFVALYFWNIMWLDAVMLLPLLALGIRKLVKEGKVLLYLVVLTLAIISNYYMGYMLGIFSILWFVYEMMVERPKVEKEEVKATAKARLDSKRKAVGKFVLTTLVAVAISAVVLVPVALYMFGGTGSQHLFLSNFMPVPRFFLPDLLGQLTTGAFNGYEHYVNGLPNVFIGVVLTVFVVLYFLNKKIEQRERIWSGIMVGILILSMWNRMLNSIWHGGAIEFWFPTRYAFVLSFVLILLAYRGVQSFEKITKKQVVGLSVIFGLIFAASLRVNQEKIWLLCLDVLIVVATIFLLKKWGKKTMIYMILAVLQLATLGVNLGFALRYLHADEQYEPRELSSFYKDNSEIIRRLKEYDDGLYRVEKTYMRSLNDAMALNYRGISQFSSTANAGAIALLERAGYQKIDNTKIVYGFGEGDVYRDAFFGIKYLLTYDELGEPYELLFEENGVKVYRNKLAMPLAMMIEKGWDDYEILKESIPEGIEGVEIDKNFSDQYLSMSVEVEDDDKELLLTIAYAPGWKAYVDGQQVKIEKASGALMKIPLESGKHKIEFKFS